MRPSSTARRNAGEFGSLPSDVKSTIGQLGPRTEEKCSSSGARLLSGLSSTIAATFGCGVGLDGKGVKGKISWVIDSCNECLEA